MRFRVVGGTAVLTISDNGRGLEPYAPRQGLGSRLVRDLATQIGATFRLVARRGVTCSFRFKLPMAAHEAKQRPQPVG